MLTPADLERFRQQLETQRTALQDQIADLEASIASPDDIEAAESDTGEAGNLLAMREDALGAVDRARTQLVEVEQALERIADGSYGRSAVSGKPIPLERLEVQPTATTLVDE